MLSKIIKGGLLSGVIVFLWASVSWMILPWHCTSMSNFNNESEVAKVIQRNTTKDGVYFLPKVYCHSEKNIELFDQKVQVGRENMKQGPIIFASIKKGGADPENPTPYALMLIVYMFAGCLISSVIAFTHLAYWSRVGMVVLIAFTAGLLCHLPSWIWYGFSLNYIFVEMADLLVGWFLGGFIIAIFMKPRILNE